MKVLIVGAGIAGLAMARVLKRSNIEFDIVEKRGSAELAGTGIALPFNAVESFKKLGLYDELMAKAHVVSSIIYSDTQGRVMSRANLKAKPFENDEFVALLRRDLYELLLADLESFVQYSRTIEKVKNDPQGIAVKFTGDEQAHQYDLLVAADGVQSAVRTAHVEKGSTTIIHPVRCWRFTCHLGDHGLEPLYLIGGTDVFMVYPIDKDTVYGYAHVLSDKLAPYRNINALEQMRNFFSGYAEPVPRILGHLHVRDILPGQVVSVDRARFYKNRVAYIGDASSACSPLLQQGAACALEDAITLGECLAADTIDHALIEYKKKRQKSVSWVVKYSDKPYRLLPKMGNPLVRGIRNLGIRVGGPINVRGWKKLKKMRAVK